jgi:vancomycin resistance protein VanJ
MVDRPGQSADGRRLASAAGSRPVGCSMVVMAYAVAIAAWFLARLAYGESFWLMAAVNSFAAWLFLPLPVMIVLAVFARRRLAWVAVLAPAVLWLAWFGPRFLPRAPHAVGGNGSLRVMAFNLLATNGDVDGMVAAIEVARPDLIALAELGSAADATLARRLGTSYPYRMRQTLPGSSFGTGIYSRWPIDSLGSLETGLGLRSAAADVRTPVGTVRFVALHPRATHVDTESYERAKQSLVESFRAREAQVTAVCRHLDGWGDRPVILAGDFNLTEFSDAYRCLAERLGDTYREVGHGFGYTWPSPWVLHAGLSLLQPLSPLTRIDYVFHSHHWVAVDAQVLDLDTGSDHLPVVVTLVIRSS